MPSASSFDFQQTQQFAAAAATALRFLLLSWPGRGAAMKCWQCVSICQANREQGQPRQLDHANWQPGRQAGESHACAACRCCLVAVGHININVHHLLASLSVSHSLPLCGHFWRRGDAAAAAEGSLSAFVAQYKLNLAQPRSRQEQGGWQAGKGSLWPEWPPCACPPTSLPPPTRLSMNILIM